MTVDEIIVGEMIVARPHVRDVIYYSIKGNFIYHYIFILFKQTTNKILVFYN